MNAAGVLNLVLSLSLSHTGHWQVEHGNLMAKNSLRDLKKELLLYIKMA